jgi:predicted 2-oxoglutarate/Fe(II)-dependent dioxygenase YbiX
VFPSHKFHNVTPVTRGVRNIVAVELWDGEEVHEDLRPGAIGHLIPDIMGT